MCLDPGCGYELATNLRHDLRHPHRSWENGKMLRLPVKPELLRWARERSGYGIGVLGKRFKRLKDWESGREKPTLKQLEAYAKAVHVPVGYFFLKEPPVENIPIPDLRTVGNREVPKPSPHLLDTIYLCQRRQYWYQDYLRSVGHEPLGFVGSTTMRHSVEATAKKMRGALGFDLEERRASPTWREALQSFVEKAEDLGIMVMINGVVGSNNRRKLDIGEFRGFALSDDLAPLIFVNGSDSKSAQMFTIAHELAHLWLGKSALNDADLVTEPSNGIEVWCNKVAAEFLVPLEMIKKEKFRKSSVEEIDRLTKAYKVSSLVIIRRLFDGGIINKRQFEEAWKKETGRLKKIPQKSGGDFYRTANIRNSKIFMYALIASTLEGRTPFTEAFRLMGIKKMETFDKIGHQFGIIRDI